MINMNKNLCMGCMNELEEGAQVCDKCGYYEGTPHLPSYLPPRSVLQDRFVVGKVLDYNGEGATYVGLDTATGVKVRIREYMPDALAGRQKGEKEIVALAGCETQFKALMADFVDLSKNLMRVRSLSSIVPVTDIFEENGTIYAVYDYVQGMTFSEYLRRSGGYLSVAEVKKLFTPLMAHINAMHSANILHRGISPDTIIVDTNGNLKLVGFSISSARIARSEIVSELYAGYAAPEQYKSGSWQGEYTDVYAIAATIYKALTGTMPPDAMSRATNDNLIPASELTDSVPQNISNTIYKAMILSPDKRTQSMIDFVTEFTEEMNFNEETEPPVANNKKKGGKNYFLISLGITAAIALVVFAAVLLILSPDLFGGSQSSGGNSSFEPLPSLSSSTNSDGQTVYATPNFVGKKYEAIIINVEYTSRFTFVKIEEFNEEYPEGIVVRQDPSEDKDITINTEIKLYVSKGSRFIEITEDQFKGKTLKQVLDVVQGQYNFGYTIKYEESDTVAPDRVIRTSVGIFDIESDKVDIEIVLAAEPADETPDLSVDPEIPEA